MIAMTGDFKAPDGGPAYPEYDLGSLATDPKLAFRTLSRSEALKGDELADVDILISTPGEGKITRASVAKAGRLALVARTGVGYEDVDAAALTEADVALAIAADAVRRPTALAALTLMLAVTSRLFEKHALTKAGGDAWDRRGDYATFALQGRTLGLVGLGSIGAEVVRLTRPLEMTVIAHDPYADKAAAAELGVRLVDLDTVLSQADVVSLHCLVTPETRKLINRERLARMKPTAYLINTARGAVVDRDALAEALNAGRIAAAGLDVLDPEPPDPDDPLLTAKNVVLSAHALNWTDTLFAAMAATNGAAIRAVLSGQAPRGVANRDVLARPGWQAKVAALAKRYGG